MERMLAEIVQITTPKQYTFKGLLFGSLKAKKAVIFTHGLAASALSSLEMIAPLAEEQIAVLTYNNRGHDVISGMKKIDKRNDKGYRREWAGMAFERFTDCIDDIQGAIDFLLSRGFEEIYLAGHSTGCQKTMYFLSNKSKQRLVKGVILLCPMSDYAGMIKEGEAQKWQKALRYAKRMVQKGQEDKLMPFDITGSYITAQRYLSLYTPDSPEEIFSYATPQKTPTIFQKVETPMLIFLAENDKHLYYSAQRTAEWFITTNKSAAFRVHIISNANHTFDNQETELIRIIKSWLVEN
jgi:alpha-beta hydrolase superfamily lysophospholipase